MTTAAKELTLEELTKQAEEIRHKVYKLCARTTAEELAILDEYADRVPTNRNYATLCVARRMNKKNS
jgi:hypothetical protein